MFDWEAASAEALVSASSPWFLLPFLHVFPMVMDFSSSRRLSLCIREAFTHRETTSKAALEVDVQVLSGVVSDREQLKKKNNPDLNG